SFMIPLVASVPEPVTALPIAYIGMFSSKLDQSILHLSVVFGISFVLVSCSGQFYQCARLSIT
ncbi:MAG TPA: hypothetical protein VF609_08190, partial [Flavisolibacter sp.]